MRKILKIFLIIASSFCLTLFLTLGVIFITPTKIELDEKKLITSSDFISFYDKNSNLIAVSNNQSLNEKLPAFSQKLQNAFIAIEDKNFFNHNGIDFKRIIKATLVNIKYRAFKQGASTISQQLVKNTHLTSEKTLSRKITEIKLTKKLEKNYTKQEILTMYLNTIYFGENCFGVTNAAKRYFDKSPNEISLSECASLAATISAPSKLNPSVNLEGNLARRNIVLARMRELNMITNDEYQEALNQKLKVVTKGVAPYSAYLNACYNELNLIDNISPYTLKNCKVLTYYNPALQEYICNLDTTEFDYQNIVLDNLTCGVEAYHTTCGEIGREIASTAKPIAVYGPAIDMGLITPYTKITDEKTTFGDYTPSNFNDKYYGDVSVQIALNKSLNVPAVKVLDYLGADNAIYYLNKMNIPCKNKGLSLALGNLSEGVMLKNLAASYTTFANLGSYKKPHFIKEIINNNGKTIYKADQTEISVFKQSTASLINDMLKKSASEGTAKKLSYIDFDLAVKTGTSGTKKGNTDCYSVGYTSQNTFGVWIGRADGGLLSNGQTGSNLPTGILGKTADYLYKTKRPAPLPEEDLVTLTLDKVSYDANGELLLASPNLPEKLTFSAKFAKENAPKKQSTIFESPAIHDLKVSLNEDKVSIRFAPAIGSYAQIYRVFEGKKTYLGKADSSFDDKLYDYGVYEYIVIPACDGKTTKTSEQLVSAKINFQPKKAPDGKTDGTPDNWWFD